MSRGRLFGSLCGMAFLVNLARVVFAPLLVEFIRVFQVGEGTAGLIVTLVWLGSAVPRLPTGWLLTRYPRHRVVLGTGALLSAAGVFTASATSVATLTVGAFLMGLASGSYFVAANPLISELFPDRVGRVMGIHGTAGQVAAVGAAPFVTAVVVVADWRAAFLAISAGAALVTVALYVTAGRADLPDAGGADRNLLGAARSQWRAIAFGVTLLGAAGFVWQGLFNFYELYMGAKGLPSGTAKNMLTVVFAAGLPAFAISGRLADRLPRLPYLLTIVAVFVATVLALTVAEGLVALIVLTALVGYVIHSLFPAMDAYLLDSLPDDVRGSAYAVYSAGGMLVQATGTSVVGGLLEAGLDFDAVFVGLASGLALVVAALTALYWLGRLPDA